MVVWVANSTFILEDTSTVAEALSFCSEYQKIGPITKNILYFVEAKVVVADVPD